MRCPFCDEVISGTRDGYMMHLRRAHPSAYNAAVEQLREHDRTAKQQRNLRRWQR